MDLSIIIPCFNEYENVPKIKRELLPVVADLAQERIVELIFVDDGSLDGTGRTLQATFGKLEIPRVRVQIERHPSNLGLGAALRTGFAASSGEILLTTDSDGTYPFDTIPGLLSCLTFDVDIVTASPYHPKGGVVGVPTYRLLLSRGSSRIYRLLVDYRLRTYTCLYRAYRAEVVRSILFQANDYLAGTELLVKAILSGYRVVEYPAVLHSRQLGVSKARLFRTVLSHLHFQSQVLFHRLNLKPLLPAVHASQG